MALVVHKYGGTSMGSIERIEAVAEKVIKAKKQWGDIVVVVSAMSGETNRLISLANQISNHPNPREMDTLMATGEQVSMALLAIALNKRGYPAVSFTGSQVKIHTDKSHMKSRILAIDNDKIEQALKLGKIVVVAGFQGADSDNNITTLGRGGSDTTAVALAASLKAKECQIYTDVDGVYTTDPRIEPKARLLNHITFDEMLEMASLGAKVLQIRSVEFAGKYRVPLRVLSSFNEGEGTLISFNQEEKMESAVITGIAFSREEAQISLINVPDQPGIAYQILGPIGDANINVDMIIQNLGSNGKTDFTFTIARADCSQAIDILEKNIIQNNKDVTISQSDIAKVSMIGAGMRSHTGIASTVFKTLADLGINIKIISNSEIKISIGIDEKYLELAVRALHEAFELDKK